MGCVKSKARWIILALSAAIILSGQATTAKIFGNVKDEDGNSLSGIAVTATNIQSNAVRTAVTGKKSGAFRLLGLEPGFYQVSFDKEGYASYAVAGIRLSAEQSITLRIKLKRKISPSEAAGSL